jgi:cytochrome c oxidase subunit III
MSTQNTEFIDINAQILREEPEATLSMNPGKFALWLFIASIVMIFASLTSAYIVRRAEGNWLVFDLPPMLYISSVVILASSATMIWSLLANKKGDDSTSRMALIITTVLGIAFTVGQFFGFKEMVGVGVYLVGNPSGSFVYILIGLHMLHIVAGMVFLLITLGQSFTGRITKDNPTVLEMCSTFWHFLGGMWIYLFLFLLLNR